MDRELIDRLPPHDRDAERAVLGALIRDPDILPDVAAVLRPEAFYLDAHQRVFTAIGAVAAAGVPIDLVAVHAELKRRGDAKDAGGAGHLAELWEAVPTGANAAHHAKLVRDASTLRGLIRVANEILREAHSPTGPAEELVAAAERKLFALAQAARGETGGARALSDVVREVLDNIDARVSSGSTLAGLATGFADLDRVLGGMRPGELLVVGARPSVGKTAFGLNVAPNVAQSGAGVLFCSLEMPAAQIGERLLSMGSGVPMHRLSRPRELRPDDFGALVAAGGSEGVGARPIFIDDESDQTAARVASEARRAVTRYGVQLVIVDYLGLMRPENPRDNQTQKIGTLALRMKQMARGLDVPVILLAQLNRDSERAARRPTLADLRDSGDIEAHADRVILLHRDPNLDTQQAVWPVELVVAKNRNGPVGDIRLAYRRPVLRFENCAVGIHEGVA
jgi:replicative DNA helicase